jgi:protein SCO1/2
VIEQTMDRRTNNPMPLIAAMVAAVLWAGPAAGQYGGLDRTGPSAAQSAAEFEGIDIVEHLDDPLPLDAQFVDADGKAVRLGDYFEGDKPVVLALVYFRCPALCGMILNGTVDVLKRVPWTAGDQFEVVVISFNHDEGPKLAAQKKAGYLFSYDRPGAENGWHFLTGDEGNIRKVTEAIGFGFRWNEKANEFMHPSAIYVITPEGRISRYLYGAYWEPKTMRLALTEASDGKVGTTVDKVLWRCSHWNPDARAYETSAMKLMKIGAPLAALLIFVAMMGLIMLRKASQARQRAAAARGER